MRPRNSSGSWPASICSGSGAGRDPSREIPDADMASAVHAHYTSDPKALSEADFERWGPPIRESGYKPAD